MLKLDLVAALHRRLPAPIRFGMAVSELISCIGPTRSVAPRSSRDSRPGILRYGDVEFHFADRGLEMLFSDSFVLSPLGSGVLSVDAGWLSRGLQVDDAAYHLRQCGALVRMVDDPWNESCCDLLIDGMSVLKFQVRTAPDDHGIGLNCIMVLAEAAYCRYERGLMRRKAT